MSASKADIRHATAPDGHAATDLTLQGTDGDDRIDGGKGHDILSGLDGDDTLTGGAAWDILRGGAGADTLLGQAGDDLLDGGDDNDHLSGGFGDDTLNGYKGLDSLFGGAGDDRLFAGTGRGNLLDGGQGADSLTGSTGDTLLGGQGNDTVLGASGDGGVFEGGAGEDRLLFTFIGDKAYVGDASFLTNPSSLHGARISGFEGGQIAFGGGDDVLTLTGRVQGWSFDGGGGDDHLIGSAHGDTLIGGAGANTLAGGGGDDKLYVETNFLADPPPGSGGSLLLGGAGDDVVQALSKITAMGGAGDDGLSGRGLLKGGAGDDGLRGLATGDHLVGGAGNDGLAMDSFGAALLEGGAGDDQITAFGTLIGGGGDDVLDSHALFNHGHSHRDHTPSLVIGGHGADTLSGAGQDTLEGGAGRDTYLFLDTTDGEVVRIQDADFGVVDLSPIDANLQTTADDPFRVVDAFDGKHGELTISYSGSDDVTRIEADVTGDQSPDLVILIKGDHTDLADYVL